MNKRRRYKAKARRAWARRLQNARSLGAAAAGRRLRAALIASGAKPIFVFDRIDPDEVAQALGAEEVAIRFATDESGRRMMEKHRATLEKLAQH